MTRLDEDHGEKLVADYTDFREVGEDRVIAFGQARIDREPDPLEFEIGLVYTFAEGKITGLEGCTDRQQAREAAGMG